MSGARQGRRVILRRRPCSFLGFSCQSAGTRGLSAANQARLADYPKRPLLRCDLEGRSISQSIQTNADPRPTMTPRNSNVSPGVVSMLNIHNSMQALYQRGAAGGPIDRSDRPHPSGRRR